MKYIFLIIGSIFMHWSFGQELPKGVVIDTVFTNFNPKQSYSLYLPKAYNPEKKWPIIYIFEPAARGKLPVAIFKQAAEAYGYILVGSNNSKNGSWQIVFEAARAMKKDTDSKFNIDHNRVYTAGFSGGSRVAMVTAKAVFDGKGIIANAGAYPTKKQYLIRAKDSIAYVGLVGNLDMNYLEHQKLAAELDAQGSKNLLIISDKPHQWISASTAYKALQWMEITTNPSISSNDKTEIKKELKVWGDSILASPESIYNVNMLAGLEADWGIKFNPQPATLLASKLVQKELKGKQKAEKREKAELSIYMEAFSSLHASKFNRQLDSIHTVQWWQLEIDKQKKKESSRKIYISRSAQRLSNYLWAGFAENSFNYERQQDYDFALQLTNLWVYAQPKSVWAMYNKAKLLSKLNMNDKAIDALYKAKELGLKRKASLTKQPVFVQLFENEKFIQLVETLEE